MTLLADVVDTSMQVAATSARSRKVALLAALLRRLAPQEVAIVTGFLTGAPRQGRIGVGYSTIYGVSPAPAATSSLTVDALDAAIFEVRRSTGAGSVSTRRLILEDLLSRATEDEASFIR